MNDQVTSHESCRRGGSAQPGSDPIPPTIGSVAVYDFPPELIKLQRDFLAADERCNKIADALPTATEIIAGAEVDWTELHHARAERLDLAIRLQQHPWWDNVDRGERGKAKLALQQSVKDASLP